jgi:AcrR family transcriptional regulator
MNVEPTSPQLDRRKRKSRAALQKALLELIAEKSYPAITIEDVTARADVARATFYAHFHDKDVLLLESTRELLANLPDQARAVVPQGQPVFSGAGVRVVFAHAEEHRDLYRLLLTGEGGREPRALMIETFRSLVSDVFSRMVEAQDAKARVPMAALVTAFVGASLLTLEALVLGELEGNPEERVIGLVQSQVNGLTWGLGLDPDTVQFTT